jgi:predicted HTH transcriptional regulator
LGLFTEETLIKDSARIKSDLFAEVDDVMGFIRKNIRKEIIITGNPQNTERWEYPLDAIRELVLNMIVHRDYTSSYDSVVKIFPDRIEFYNPGALPDEISLQQLLEDYYVSQPRNKLIAEMFKEAGLIEKYGSGIKRVIQAFDEMNLPKPNFISMPSGFKVVVYGRKTDLKTDLKTENGMRTDLKTDLKTENGMRTDLKTDLKTENGMGTDLKTDLKTGNGIKTDLKIDTVDMLIVEMIAQNATITIPEIAQRINKGYSATKVRLAKLKQNDYVERIGSLKGGYWKIKKVNPPSNRNFLSPN